MERPSPEEQPVASSAMKIKLFIGVLVVLVVGITFSFMPPVGFPAGETITIARGSSLGQVSHLLKDRKVIRSRMAFEFCMISSGGEKHVVARDYVFKEPMNACVIAYRIAHGVSGIAAVKVTIPEGVSNREIAALITKNIPAFNGERFVNKARTEEGYLFPDTYFLSPSATSSDVITLMSDNFKTKIDSLMPEVLASGHSLRDIIIMASILEKEARTPKDQALVSGILWKRIDHGMSLQVDAPFYYLLGKESAELTQTDLAMKSGYNTYKNKGLPVGPIGNPGLAAIRAAITPTVSPYLYYLSGKEGVMHYAKTFEEHKANKARYLYK